MFTFYLFLSGRPHNDRRIGSIDAAAEAGIGFSLVPLEFLGIRQSLLDAAVNP